MGRLGTRDRAPVHSYMIAVAAPAVPQRKWYSRWYALIAATLTLFVLVLRPGARDGTYQYATERLGEHEATLASLQSATHSTGRVSFRPDHYVVFGDRRDNSRDSRFREVGFVPRDPIIGRVVKVVGEPNPH